MNNQGVIMKKLATSTLWIISLTIGLPGQSHAAIDFSNYHTPSQVNTILNDLVTAHPGLAQVSTIGTSHNGTPINVLTPNNIILVVCLNLPATI